MCQLRKSFQQGSPEALPQPSLCAGDGRLGRDLPPSPLLFPAPCQAGILLLLLLPGTWALLRVFLCSAPEPCMASISHQAPSQLPLPSQAPARALGSHTGIIWPSL